MSIICKACDQEIIEGEIIKSNNFTYHSEHFCCQKCRKNLNGEKFAFKDTQLYCEEDYIDLFGTKCYLCNKGIIGTSVQILGKVYHKDCLNCFICKNKFSDSKFFNDNDHPVCFNCFKQNLQKCSNCGEIITDKMVDTQNGYYHVHCLICCGCGKEIEGGALNKVGNDFYHKNCLKIFCQVCHQEIIDKFLKTETGIKVHIGCSDKLEKSQNQNVLANQQKEIETENKPHQNVQQHVQQQFQTQQQENHNKEIQQQQRMSEMLYDANNEPKINLVTGLQNSIAQNEEKSKENKGQQIHDVRQIEKYYDYDFLKNNFPDNLDPSEKEFYLSPQEFLKVFGMDKTKFYELAKWKQNNMKKDVGLFQQLQ